MIHTDDWRLRNRSGTASIETRGNYNDLGWHFGLEDEDLDWQHTGNRRHEPADFYSVVRHEMTHALVFHAPHVAYQQRKGDDGRFHEPIVARYLGGEAPRVDRLDHFPATVDPVSLFGVFGNEYGSMMPKRRWLLTKFDLLAISAAGYPLRDVTALAPLEVSYPGLADLEIVVDAPVEVEPVVSGGIPPLRFVLRSGRWPRGVAIDSFTGRISGTPTETGRFDAVIEVRDHDESGSAPVVAVPVVLEVAPPADSKP